MICLFRIPFCQYLSVDDHCLVPQLFCLVIELNICGFQPNHILGGETTIHGVTLYIVMEKKYNSASFGARNIFLCGQNCVKFQDEYIKFRQNSTPGTSYLF